MNGLDERLRQLVEEFQSNGYTLEDAAETFDAQYVRTALLRTGGNITEASLLIGVHRNTLHNRLSQNEALRVKPKVTRRVSGFERWKNPRKGRGR